MIVVNFAHPITFQSPHGDFGVLNSRWRSTIMGFSYSFQSPHGDFGVLNRASGSCVSLRFSSFNPLTGILVF